MGKGGSKVEEDAYGEQPLDADALAHSSTSHSSFISASSGSPHSSLDELKPGSPQWYRRRKNLQDEGQTADERELYADEREGEDKEDLEWFHDLSGPVPELPVEIFGAVLSFLSLQERCVAGAVCRQWHELAWSTLTRLEFSLRHRADQETIIVAIANKCGFLRQLSLRDCFVVSGRIMRYLPPSLQQFHFHNCPNLPRTLANDDLKKLPSLLSLSLPHCTHLTDDVVPFLPQSLAELDATEWSVTDAGLMHLPRQLKSLRITGCTHHFRVLCDLPPGLESLDASQTLLEDDALQDLPDSLTSLSLRGARQVTDQGLAALHRLTNLVRLELDRTAVTDQALGCLPPLHTLSLRECPAVTDKGVQLLPPSVRDLNLWGCAQLTPAVTAALPALLESLNLLRVRIDDSSLATVPRTLKRLCLFGCSVTDQGVALLPSAMIYMRELDLSWSKVTDRSLPLLAAKMPHLSLVQLGNTGVTRDGILIYLENALPAVRVMKGPGHSR